MKLNIIMMGGNFDAMNQMKAMSGNNHFKVNLCFTTLKGAKIMMPLDCDETIDEVLTKFLKRVNLEYLIGNLQNKLKFIMSAENIQFGDFRKLKEVIPTGSTALNVFVHDTQNLIGA